MLRLKGKITLRGDKSLAHRAYIMAALADGSSHIKNSSRCMDVVATRHALCRLGVLNFDERDNDLVLTASPWKSGHYRIDCKNSGTTMRLLMGVIAGMPGVNTSLEGDQSLAQRPMDRVAIPLSAMGAQVSTNNGFPPIEIHGTSLSNATIRSKVPSAQVKSAVLLAGLLARGTTTYIENLPTRDHTERLFQYLGLPVAISPASGEARAIQVRGPARPRTFSLHLPGDTSNASVLAALALSLPGSDIVLSGVLCNPLRNGFFEALSHMGAHISTYVQPAAPESTCTIHVSYTRGLRDFHVSRMAAITMIDEIPVFVVTAVLHGAKGIIRNIRELRVKESDRAQAIVDLMGQIGVTAYIENEDLLITDTSITRPDKLVYKGMDHRMGFAYKLAGMALDIPVEIERVGLLSISYPDFEEDLKVLMQ